MARAIPLARPSIDDADVVAVGAALRSGWLGPGPRVEEFERDLAAYVGARDCVAVASGSAALQLALLLRLEPGDEVIVPAITFVATAHAALHAGGRVVLADVDRETLTLSPADVARKLTPRTRAVVPVHYGGHAADLDALRAVLAGSRAVVVEDAAHAIGARYKGRRIGALSTSTCFSFNAVKNLTTVEGGAVTTDAAADAVRVRRLCNHGIDRGTWARVRTGRLDAWDYAVAEPGFKYAMSDVAAALGCSQLRRLEAMNARRRRLAARYDERLRTVPWVERPVVAPWATSAYHHYAVRVGPRDALCRHLGDHGVATSVHYRPLHHHPVFGAQGADVPVAEEVWRRILLLPLFPDLSDDDQDYVVDTLRAFGRARGLA